MAIRVPAGPSYDELAAHLVTAGVVSQSRLVALGATGLLDNESRRTPVGRMSEGQRRRVDLALKLAVNPHLLILDEPTNHLSMGLVDELTEAIRATRAAVVVATHDRQLIRDLADWRTIRLHPGGS